MMHEDVAYQKAHKNLVEQHAYLTNRVKTFVTSLGALPLQTQDRISVFSRAGATATAAGGQIAFDDAEIRSYREHTKVRAGVEIQHRQNA